MSGIKGKVAFVTGAGRGIGAATAELLVPLYRALGEQVLASQYIQADETPIQVQDQRKKGKTHGGYFADGLSA